MECAVRFTSLRRSQGSRNNVGLMTVLNLIARLRSSPLIGNLAKVTSGTIAAQAIMFAFSPIITRLYGPEAFGIQGVFLSLVAILSPAIALSYPMAIIEENSDENARRL